MKGLVKNSTELIWGLLGFCFLAICCSVVADSKPQNAWYILGFTFEKGYNIDNIPEKALTNIDKSVFDGIAVSYTVNLSVKPGKTLDQFEKDGRLKVLKSMTTKDIWPIVYLNAIVGYDKAYCRVTRNEHDKFKGIKGFNFDNISLLAHNWTEALKIAKALNSPGIIFDGETYNSTDLNHLKALVDKTGLGKKVSIKKLKNLGAKLADLTNETYPDAEIWFLFTSLDCSNRKDGVVGYIVLGLLERSKERNYSLKVIDGGEGMTGVDGGGLGYLHPSAQHLREVIDRRFVFCKDVLREYPRNYALAGVNAPLVDYKTRPFWMEDGRIGNFTSLEKHEPLYEELLKNYKYIWIYCAYRAFDLWGTDSIRFSKMLESAMAKTKYSPVDPDKIPAISPFPPSSPARYPFSCDMESVFKTPDVSVLTDFSSPQKDAIELMKPYGSSNLVNLSNDKKAKYVAELTFYPNPLEKNKEASFTEQYAYYPGLTITKLPSGLSSYGGIAIDVKNAGEDWGEFGLQLRCGKKAWHVYQAMKPGEEVTLSVKFNKVKKQLGGYPEKVELFTRRPKSIYKFKIGPCALIKK